MSKVLPTAAVNLLFLGAGASRPLGKMTMDEFIDHLLNDPQIADRALFRDLISSKRDLEYVLEELQDIESKRYLKYRLTDDHNYMYPPSPGQPIRDERSFQELSAVASALRSKIEEHVFRQYRAFDNLRLVNDVLKPVFDKIADASASPLVVFTTNYDPAVEKFCGSVERYHCIDGFKLDEKNRQYCWDRSDFETAEAPFGRRPVYLFKLHGSVNWVESEGRIVRGEPIFAGKDKVHRNILIYPAMRKVALDDPFFTAYMFLRACLEHAKWCLVIGYSFRDYDALTQFRAAVRQNPKLSIQVLDPAAENIVRVLRGFEINAKAITGRLLPNGTLPASVSPCRG